jgi:hypothetical protein
MPVVFYTGFGAKPSGLHTPLEFLRIMRKHFAKHYPKNAKMTWQQWARWAGATVRRG